MPGDRLRDRRSGTGFDGQQVGREHPVEDGDVVELHS